MALNGIFFSTHERDTIFFHSLNNARDSVRENRLLRKQIVLDFSVLVAIRICASRSKFFSKECVREPRAHQGGLEYFSGVLGNVSAVGTRAHITNRRNVVLGKKPQECFNVVIGVAYGK